MRKIVRNTCFEMDQIKKEVSFVYPKLVLLRKTALQNNFQNTKVQRASCYILTTSFIFKTLMRAKSRENVQEDQDSHISISLPTSTARLLAFTYSQTQVLHYSVCPKSIQKGQVTKSLKKSDAIRCRVRFQEPVLSWRQRDLQVPLEEDLSAQLEGIRYFLQVVK